MGLLILKTLPEGCEIVEKFGRISGSQPKRIWQIFADCGTVSYRSVQNMLGEEAESISGGEANAIIYVAASKNLQNLHVSGTAVRIERSGVTEPSVNPHSTSTPALSRL